jgi:hypothetical protein
MSLERTSDRDRREHRVRVVRSSEVSSLLRLAARRVQHGSASRREVRGSERNAPNTIGGACTDGSAGLFHLDESVEAIEIASLDESPFAGQGVEVRVKMWAYVDHARRRRSLLAADAAEAFVAVVGTLVPSDAERTRSRLRFTLRREIQALRVAVRTAAPPRPATGLYDDRDDPSSRSGPAPDTSLPTVAVTAPAARRWWTARRARGGQRRTTRAW